MLRDRTDEYLGARLVADARLHLGSIMNGQYSEPFFLTMCRIVHYKVYLGYKTFEGKKVELKGIKDFLYSAHYGLGLRRETINRFHANISRLAMKDKSQGKNALRFVDWLRQQDKEFYYPLEVFEYRRVVNEIDLLNPVNRTERWRQLRLAESLFIKHPEVLALIGADRKYKTVHDCADDLGLKKKKKVLRPYLYQVPTDVNLKRLAKQLCQMLELDEQKTLITNMISQYKSNLSQGDGQTT